MVAWVVLAFLQTGPVLDPVAGSTVRTEDREILPSSRHLGSVADLWFVEIVNMQQGGAGIATFDPLYFTSHGRSWTQNTYELDGLDITDPFLFGRPILHLPQRAWSSLHYRSLNTSRPGFAWRTEIPKGLQTGVRLGGGGAVGGGLWLPHGFFDRDPATGFGATSDRRALEQGFEGDASISWGDGKDSREAVCGAS